MTDFAETAWGNASVYRDFTGDAIARSFQRMDGNAIYEDFSNRNDIDKIAVARDYENLYFRIQTVDDITPYAKGDERWMNIRLNTENTEVHDSLGYEFILNSRIIDGSTSQILKADGQGSYTVAGTSEYSIQGNVMLVKVPLQALGLDAAHCKIQFKVSDNVKPTDVLEFYVSGDSAPIGTLNYQFGY